MIVTTWLEIADPAALAAAPAVEGIEIERVADPALNRDLYAEVGARWSWSDRLPWTDEQWAAWARRVETWVARLRGEIAGYYELAAAADGSVEIAIFGLRPGFEGDPPRLRARRAPRVGPHVRARRAGGGAQLLGAGYACGANGVVVSGGVPRGLRAVVAAWSDGT